MKSCLTVILVSHLLVAVSPVSAQKWIRMMQDPDVNFYDVKKEFNRYWNEKEMRDGKDFDDNAGNEGEEENYMQYKRWEEYMEPRIYPSGKRIDPALVSAEYQHYLAQNSTLTVQRNSQANWTIIGPVYQGCAGRIICVRFHPLNPNTIYAGAETGGLWKSVDGGITWATNTDNLASLKIRDLTFDPENANTMYMTTDIALFKSTDGGNTWNQTALSGSCVKVIVNPVNSSIVLASTNSGIFRSTDGGISFTQVATGILFKCLKFNVGNSNIVFATDYQKFYRSDDGGQSFSVITSGLPSANFINLQMATTIADPDYVYVVASDINTSGFAGLYLSTDGGLTFLQKSNSPNIVGGQGWFALAIAASPTNKDEVVVGGLNIYRSQDSGMTWNQISTWNVSSMTGQVHVDIIDLQYYNGTTIYAATDGGVFSTADNGNTWSNHAAGLQVIQPYGFGISQTTPALVMVGTQDNGTKTFNGVSWVQNIGGDGSVCFIDWSTDTYRYGSVPIGGNLRLAGSTNGGSTYNYVDAGITETTNKIVIPWMQDPADSATLYAGYTNVWKSSNHGNSWNKISTFGGGITAISVCKANNNCICAATAAPRRLYRTINGGATWTDITGTLPITSVSIKDIAIKDSDPNMIWVVCSGSVNGNKVFESNDGGTIWHNISGTLPDIPFDCIAYQNGSQNGIYVGADIGVYYRDSVLNTWIPFNTGLPNVRVTQLKVQYPAGKIRASLYGRGIWESDLYDISTRVVQTDLINSIEIYPNPFSSQVILQTRNILHNATLTMSNCFGQTVKQIENISGNTVTLYRNNLPAGLYFVRLTQDNKQIETKKLFVSD